MRSLLSLVASAYVTRAILECPDLPETAPVGTPRDCTLHPNQATDKVLNSAGMVEINAIFTNEITGNAVLECDGTNCKDFLRVYAGGLGNFLMECNSPDSCKNAQVRVGDVDKAPVGYNLLEFQGRRNDNAKVDIDCGGQGSCAEATVYAKGNYTGGVEVTALSQDSFVKGTLVCDLLPGQTCKLICGKTTSCAASQIVCMGGQCDCIGRSCPNIVFPPGSDPAEPVVIGKSPNIPGLDCIAGTDDNPPDECRFEKILRQNLQGAVTCTENYDCCLCERIQCDDCTAVNCGGDQGCIGVPIYINGDAKLGASLNCNGDLSCEFSKVVAENLVAIKADGDLSLLGSDLELNLNIKEDSILPALNIPCNGDGSCMGAKVTAKNLLKLICDGDFSCDNTVMDLKCQILGKDKGCILSCGGDNSCSDSVWEAFGVVAFSANGDHSASRNLFNCTFVEAGAPLSCTGDNSCQEGKFILINVNRLECAGDQSCEKSNYNAACVAPIGCPVGVGGDSGAKLAVWKIINAQSLSCTGRSSCEKAKLDIAGVGGGCPVSCGGESACKETQLTLSDVSSLACSGISGCRNGNFNIVCFSPGDDKGCPVSCNARESCYALNLRLTNAMSVSCLGEFACKMANLNVDCAPGPKGCPLTCGGVRSCPDANIVANNVAELIFQGREVATNLVLNAKCATETGCKVSCQGVAPCSNSTMIVKNVRALTCVGLRSCDFSNLNLNCLDSISGGCPTNCGSTKACTNSVITINNSGGLSCVREACSDSTFKFSNNKGGILSCVGIDACRNSIIDRLDNIESCVCSGSNACKNSKIFGKCREGGCKLSFSGFEVARGATVKVENVNEMKCDDTNACSDADIEVYTNQVGFKASCTTNSCINSKIKIKSKGDTEGISGFECSSSFACANSEIIFDGTDLFTKRLFVGDLKCAAPMSCVGTKFILKNAKINIDTLLNACTGIHACDGNEISLVCQDYYGNILEDAACITDETF